MDINEVFGKIGFDFKMFLFNVVNFLIVLFLVRKFFFGKIINIIESRQEKIKEGLDNTEKLKHELAMAEKKAEEIISSAETQANKMLIHAKKDATALTSEEIKKAEKEIIEKQMDADKKIKQEREIMFSKLKKQTADLAILATEKIIREKLDKKADSLLIDSYLNDLEKNEQEEK